MRRSSASSRLGGLLALAISASLVVLVAACGRPAGPFDALPTHLHGEEVGYGIDRGLKAPEWAQRILAKTDRPIAALSVATARTADGPTEVLISAIHIDGVAGSELAALLVDSVYVDPSVWVETIDGREVTRIALPGNEGSTPFYLYGFGETAVLLVVRQEADAMESIQSMPRS